MAPGFPPRGRCLRPPTGWTLLRGTSEPPLPASARLLGVWVVPEAPGTSVCEGVWVSALTPPGQTPTVEWGLPSPFHFEDLARTTRTGCEFPLPHTLPLLQTRVRPPRQPLRWGSSRTRQPRHWHFAHVPPRPRAGSTGSGALGRPRVSAGVRPLARGRTELPSRGGDAAIRPGPRPDAGLPNTPPPPPPAACLPCSQRHRSKHTHTGFEEVSRAHLFISWAAFPVSQLKRRGLTAVGGFPHLFSPGFRGFGSSNSMTTFNLSSYGWCGLRI